ncbi:MAG TPA: hypothetical protein VD931_09100 [Baekduia sp.]|nr:hypothetical protein [Baekduia sp.]
MRHAAALLPLAFALAALPAPAARAKGPGAAACDATALCVLLDGEAAAAVTWPAAPAVPPWDPGPALRVQVSGPHRTSRAPVTVVLAFLPREGLLQTTGGLWSRPSPTRLAALRAATRTLALPTRRP